MALDVASKVSHSILFYLVRALLLVPLGFALATLGVVLLWMNEGLPNLHVLAEATVEADANDPRSVRSGPVSVTGPLTGGAAVGDSDFIDPDPSILSLTREVEMFAWHQVANAHEERHVGGGRTITTTYAYLPSWTSTPPDHTEFRVPDGHENPPLPFENARFQTDAWHVGAWNVPAIADFLFLPGEHLLFLDTLPLKEPWRQQTRRGNTIYLGDADPDQPRVGDVRLRFRGQRTGETVTVFGSASSGEVVPSRSRSSGTRFFDLHNGDREGAIEVIRAEDELRLFLLRLLGFLLLWGGLFLTGSMVVAFADVVPLAGTIARIALLIGTLPMALAIGATTVGLAIIGHNPLATGAVLLGMVGIVWLVYTLGPRWKERRRVLRETEETHMTSQPVEVDEPA